MLIKPGKPHLTIQIQPLDWTLALISIPVTTIVLSRFAALIEHLLSLHYNWQFELCMVICQIVFQSLFILKRKSRLLPYALQLLKVSLLGSALLIPLVLVSHWFDLADIQKLLYFFTVAGIMFFVHKGMVKRLQLPWYLSYTWVGYRIIILIFIL